MGHFVQNNTETVFCVCETVDCIEFLCVESDHGKVRSFKKAYVLKTHFYILRKSLASDKKKSHMLSFPTEEPGKNMEHRRQQQVQQ